MKNNKIEAFAALEQGVYAALETYSNVHRGSGHNSLVTTRLFEQARDIVLDYLGLDKKIFVLIFSSPAGAAALKSQLEDKNYQCLTGAEICLPLGICAMAIKKNALPKGAPSRTGGGTARLTAPGWIIWAGAPQRFEAGTPAIINIIAFARALQIIRQYGFNPFADADSEPCDAAGILYHDELEAYTGRQLLGELRKSHIGRNHPVPTREGSSPFINLDNAASTPTFTPIWNAVRRTWRQPRPCQRELIREVRSICAKALDASPDNYDVIFTSNTTEAINLAAESLGREPANGEERVVITTLLEHTSNDLPWRLLPGHEMFRLSIDGDGVIDLRQLEALLFAYNRDGRYGNKIIRLVAVSGASNVLGIYNDMAEISRIVHEYGARLLVDAAQWVAHRKVDMEKCGIDYLCFSAHKAYAPFGSGALVVRKGLLAFDKAEMEVISSSGEENAEGIAALGKALVLLQRVGMDVIMDEEQALTRRALIGIVQIPGIRIYGIKDPDSPRFSQKGGVIVFSMKGMMPDKLARELVQRGGIGVRYGCHCAHLLVKHLLGVGHGLERFQRILLTLLPWVNLPGVLRVSLGIENTEEDVDTLIRVLGEIAGNPADADDRSSSSKQVKRTPLIKKDLKNRMTSFVVAAAGKVFQ